MPAESLLWSTLEALNARPHPGDFETTLRYRHAAETITSSY